MIISLLKRLNDFVWGIPALVMIVGVGLYISIRTGFPQIRLLPKALKSFFSQLHKKESDEEGISPFKALCTALAATVGTGNLAGVAGAIAIGGPGAVFWMWVCAFLGMATKYAEATLALRYRRRNDSGEYIGGPMYMIEDGMGKKWKFLASIYCFFGVTASFGVGNATQINTVVSGINSAIGSLGGNGTTLGNLLIGAGLAILILVILLGGAQRIGDVTQMLVPFAAVIYIVLGVGVLLINCHAIPQAFAAIVKGAFCPKAVTGGMLGSAFTSLRIGASRGVFTNEAGMGTASIAHASAEVEHPAQQGLMGIVEVFLDTIVICTITALVILCSGVTIPYGTDVGVALTSNAFSSVFGNWISVLIAALLCLFAIATVLGWGLYGMRSAQYLFGQNVWRKFAFLQAGMVLLGAVMGTGTVWILSDIVNGLMAIPNLIALIFLCPELVQLTGVFKRLNTGFMKVKT